MKKRFFVLLMALALFIVGCSGEKTPDEGEKEGIKDGTYTSASDGYAGEVKVETTIKDGKITEVIVLENGETPDIGGKAIEELPGKIVAEQSLKVDTVAGATMTSEAILKAVESAILAAEGNLADFQ